MLNPLLTISLLSLTLAQGPSDDFANRKRNPFAPSLPQLTEKEEAHIDRVIDRFILYDTGKLKGPEGIQALRQFQQLGPEAIPGLIRGMNRAAKINHSCPALVIAKKLNKMFISTKDVRMLQFARDEIGSGVGPTRHTAIIKDLKFQALMKKNALLRQGIGPLSVDGRKMPSYMSIGELTEAASKDTGSRLKRVITELGTRKNEEAIEALGAVFDRQLSDMTSATRKALVTNLQRKQTAETIRKLLKAERSEFRQAAIRAGYARKLPIGDELIDLLSDKDDEVSTLAHRALVLLAKRDFGPSMAATPEERKKAIERWRQWWQSRSR